MIKTPAQDVIEETKTLLKGRSGDVATVLKVSDEYLQEGDWLHIIIYPETEGVSALDYVDEIESIEEELRKRFGNEILIVSARP